MRLQRFLATPVLSVEGSVVSGLDVIVAAVLDGEWQTLESRLTGSAAERPAVEGSVVAFRYARRLISAADFKAWLDARWLTPSDVEDYLGCSPSEAGDVASAHDRLYVSASCGGVLARAAETLRQGLIAAVSWGPADAGSTGMEVIDLVHAWWSASPVSALITEAELLDSAHRVAGLAWSLAQLTASVASAAAVARSVHDNSAGWEQITLQSLTFASMSAAREAQLQLSEGVPSADLEEFALECGEMSFFLEDACASLQAELLAPHRLGSGHTGPDVLSVSWLDAGVWRAGLVTARTLADAAHERMADRARRQLMTAELARLGAGRVITHAAL